MAASASQRAREYLVELVAAQAGKRTRLPTVAAMGSRAGVAKGTMHRAVKRLVREGVLSARPGSGVTVGPAPLASRSSRPSTTCQAHEQGYTHKADWLAAAIQRDLANGVYAPGSQLPRVKQLCSSYGAGHRAVQAALGFLVRRRVLAPWGRGYRVPSLAASARGSAILVVGRGSGDYLQLVTERTAECVATLEHECSNRNLALRIAPAYYDRGEVQCGPEAQRLAVEGAAARGILGCVVFSAALYTEAVERILSLLGDCGAPIAVIDEATAAALTPRPSVRRIRVCAVGYGATCGEAVGRLLLQLGHRRVAYVASAPEGAWSRDRLAGLDRGIRPTGEGEAVRQVIVERAVLEPGTDLAARAACGPAGARLLSRMQGYPPFTRGMLWPEQQIQRLMESFAPWKETCRVLDGLLADPAITAWVADNDPTAVVCQGFLGSRGVRLPRDMSLVGFDDSGLALVNNLTSYNFNCRAVMLAALQHILSPARSRPGRTGPARVEIEGYIAQRGTTGPAPQSTSAAPTARSDS